LNAATTQYIGILSNGGLAKGIVAALGAIGRVVQDEQGLHSVYFRYE
jgi:hypothetical protein